jgi:CzcA family heavy metal efflux pump
MSTTSTTPSLTLHDEVEALRKEVEGGFVLRHRKAILFLTLVLCIAGVYSATTMPAAVFPQTDFPRVVILLDNGVMPADEMMATITRPIEEAMKNIPGTANIRSTTGRGSAAINVFFEWKTDMVQAELYVLGRLAQIRSTLPATTETAVYRLNFSVFPVLGISLTSKTRSMTDLWEIARYDLNPRFLRIPGVARINLVGGRIPEYHVVVDPAKLDAYRLNLDQVSKAMAVTNLFTPAGLHEENHQLYLAVVDNRIRDPKEIGEVVVAWSGQSPIRVKDIATIRHGSAPQFNIVTADGRESVLLNVYAQPSGSNIVAIADAIQEEIKAIRKDLAPDLKLAFFYDQSAFVREGMGSVWESIFFGLALSILVLLVFLRSFASTFVAAAVIPVTVLITLCFMRLLGMSFNLMTLGGIAAAIGLVIDDAIVVVEAIYAKIQAGHSPAKSVQLAIHEVGIPLVGSTLTPVVVFIPLAYLEGVAGVFFRALATTMGCALLTSLLLAVTWTPAIGALLMRQRKGKPHDEMEQGGPLLRLVIRIYEAVVRVALRFAPVTALVMIGIVVASVFLFDRLETDFLPGQDEGAFVLDYRSRPGTSLSETDRMLRHVELILMAHPDVESFSRRTGARLALAIAEPNTGDFLVKLKPKAKGKRSDPTDDVKDELRKKIQAAEPALHTEFPGILGDLIGDLTWSPKPVEIKIFSNDVKVLREKAEEVAKAIEGIKGVVDVDDGLIVAGPSMRFHVRAAEATRAGLTAEAIGDNLHTALIGNASSYMLQGDRTLGIRVMTSPQSYSREGSIVQMPLRGAGGASLTLQDVADAQHDPGILEMHREDLRQLTAVSASFSGLDLGRGIPLIKEKIASTVKLPPGTTIEYGGLYQQQQESFRNLAFVLLMAIFLVYGVLILEFRSIIAPLAIVIGSVLALFGVIGALYVTHTTLNIVSFLGAIIGVGIVAKNGILMLDYVDHLQERGMSTFEALVQSGRRRLRPVLMTSMATFLGLLPLAYGVGAGADMLRPLAIAVLGALVISLLLSLIATPVAYYLMVRVLRLDKAAKPADGGAL